MKFSNTLKGALGVLFVFSLFASTQAFAGDPLITSSFSGIWDQPEQESQGIILQIGEQDDDQKVGIAYWFTYGPDLQTSWYLGVGPVTGNTIDMVLYTASDVAFMADNLEGNEEVVAVGSLNLDFHNCNKGTAAYEFIEDEVVTDSGEFPIKRISSIYRMRCSGGISDDTPAGGKPMQLEVRLYPVEEDGAGEGKAKFWQRTDRSDFKVEVEDVPDGDTYVVRICWDNADPAVEVKEFDMVVFEGEGELEFRDPEIDDKLHLNFDPRGCKIELLEGGVVLLTTGDEVLSDKKTGKPDDDDDDDGLKIEADLTNTGVIEGAKGEAEFEMDSDETEFSIKIKDVPAGLYAFDVDGVNYGDIEVVEDDGKFEGKLKFSDPQEGDDLELLFDPRGQLIEVFQNDAEGTPLILEVLFPSE